MISVRNKIPILNVWNFSSNDRHLLIALIILVEIFVFIISQEHFANIGNLILLIVTTIYVYFTYELVRSGKQSTTPLFDVELIFSDKLEGEFEEKFQKHLQIDDYYQQNRRRMGEDRNIIMVFAKVQNLGNANAMSVNVKFDYDKYNLRNIDTISKEKRFGTIKKDDTAILALDLIENVSSDDYLHLKKCRVSYVDINSRSSGDSPVLKTVTKDVKSIHLGTASLVAFRKD